MDYVKFLACTLMAAILCSSAYAFPPLPCQFFGRVISDQDYAPQGSNVSAYDPDGTLCGTVSLESPGTYLVSCRADDPETIADEGAKEGDIISFSINDEKTMAKSRWHEGSFVELDVRKGAPPIEAVLLSEKPKYSDNSIMVLLFLAIIAFIIYRLKRGQDGDR